MSLDLKSYLSNNGFYENNSDIRKVPVGAVMALIWNIYDIHPLIMEFAKKYNEGREAFAKIEEGFAGGEDEAATTKKYSIEKLKDQFYVLDQDLNYIRGIRTGNYSTTLGDYLKNNGFHPDAGPIRLPAIETAEVITCIGQICDYVGEFIGEFNSRGPDLSVDFEEYKFTERYALCKEKLKTIGYYPIDEVVDEELLPSDIA